jgi:integrase
VANTLKEWKLASPPSELVFTDVKGGVEFYQHIVNRGLIPLRSDSWLAERPKYTGLHALRHFYASWCISDFSDLTVT